MYVFSSDGARCLNRGGGGTRKPDLPVQEAFHKHRTREFDGESACSHSPPPKKKKLHFGLAETQFSAVLRGLLALFLVDLLSHYILSSLTPAHPHYLYANLDELQDPIFKKWGGSCPQTPRGSASGI